MAWLKNKYSITQISIVLSCIINHVRSVLSKLYIFFTLNFRVYSMFPTKRYLNKCFISQKYFTQIYSTYSFQGVLDIKTRQNANKRK